MVLNLNKSFVNKGDVFATVVRADSRAHGFSPAFAPFTPQQSDFSPLAKEVMIGRGKAKNARMVV